MAHTSEMESVAKVWCGMMYDQAGVSSIMLGNAFGWAQNETNIFHTLPADYVWLSGITYKVASFPFSERLNSVIFCDCNFVIFSGILCIFFFFFRNAILKVQRSVG